MILAGASSHRDLRKILSPPVIAILIFVALNFARANAWLPDIFLRTVHSLANCAVPLALILTGATFADQVAELHSARRIASGCRSLRAAARHPPDFFLALAKWLPCSLDLKHVIVVQAAMPAGMLPLVIAKHYGGNPKIALQIVLATTIVSIATAPLWIRFGLALVGH